jgi:hypothetical protein
MDLDELMLHTHRKSDGLLRSLLGVDLGGHCDARLFLSRRLPGSCNEKKDGRCHRQNDATPTIHVRARKRDPCHAVVHNPQHVAAFRR